MPTCACENRILDEESHECQLKPPIENDEEETQEYDPAVRYLIFFSFCSFLNKIYENGKKNK